MRESDLVLRYIGGKLRREIKENPRGHSAKICRATGFTDGNVSRVNKGRDPGWDFAFALAAKWWQVPMDQLRREAHEAAQAGSGWAHDELLEALEGGNYPPEVWASAREQDAVWPLSARRTVERWTEILDELAEAVDRERPGNPRRQRAASDPGL